MNIRQAEPADAAVIAEFNRRLASETEDRRLDPAVVLRGVSALLADPAKGIYFVAELDRRIVGQLLITYEWSDWRDGNFWWIQSVYVAADFRNQGVFRTLYDHIRKAAESRPEICGIRLYVEEENVRARDAYEHLGMKATSYRLHELDFGSK